MNGASALLPLPTTTPTEPQTAHNAHNTHEMGLQMSGHHHDDKERLEM